MNVFIKALIKGAKVTPKAYVNVASKQAKIDFRSTSQQIEYWARTGQAAEENSDLSVPFYKEIVAKLEKMDDNATSNISQYIKNTAKKTGVKNEYSRWKNKW